jgi:dienelactone hydrolase
MSALEKLVTTHAGTELWGEIATPAGTGPDSTVLPAVLVFSSAYGLGDQARRSAQALADRGYVAVATDMYGKGAFFPNPSDAGADFTTLMSSPALMRARVVHWFDHVAALPQVDATRIAAIGYCFGGRCVLELARSGANVRAVSSFHGILTTAAPAELGAITGEVAVWAGGQDPYAPVETITALAAELSAANARHQITIFDYAAHSFTDPDAGKHGAPGIEYNALADRVSWAGTVALLDEVLA